MMQKFFLVVLGLFLYNCAGSKLKKYLKEGEVLQKRFKTTIPFEIRGGFMVIQVNIEGRGYDFILDTGALNIFSPELKNILGLTALGSQDIEGIYGKAQKIEYAKVNTIEVGGIKFNETLAAFSDFTNMAPFSCLDIDGLIGSNLMQHAIWDFNFESKTITITDNEINLSIPKKHYESKFYVGYAGIPSVTTKVNGHRVLNNTIDFGFNGGVYIPLREFQEQQGKKITNYVKKYGEGPIGLNGNTGNITSYMSKINELKFGNLTINDRTVNSTSGLDPLFGLSFFKSYRVIMNWKTKRIKMIKNTMPIDNQTINYGLEYAHKDSMLYVSNLIEGSTAAKFLQINDQIIAIDDKNYKYINEKEWCDILLEGIFSKSKNKVLITVIRNQLPITFELEKTVLLQ